MSKISYLDHIATLLPIEEVADFQSCYQQKLPKTIKIVASKIAVDDFIRLVSDMGWELDKTINSDCFYVRKFTNSATLGQHFLHQGWFFYIQELSASMSAPLLDAKQWDIILDMCAAPGWKTVQLADTWAFVIANEPLNPRRKALIYNLNRTWMFNTAITNIDGSRFGQKYPEFFDKILVDAPCSWEGMSYKTWGPLSRNENQVKSLARIQIKLLESAIYSCKVSGTIVYSTCTLNKIENEEVIETISQKYKWIIELDFSKKYRPHRDFCGWFFLAKFKKLQRPIFDEPNKVVNLPIRTPDFNIWNAFQNQVKSYLSEKFAIKNISKNILFYSTINSVYLTTTDYLSIHAKLSLDKVWIPLFNISRDWRRIPLHSLGNILWRFASKCILKISDQQAQEYAEQKNLKINQKIQVTDDNFLLLKRNNYGFSLAKKVDDFLKNKLS